MTNIIYGRFGSQSKETKLTKNLNKNAPTKQDYINTLCLINPFFFMLVMAQTGKEK